MRRGDDVTIYLPMTVEGSGFMWAAGVPDSQLPEERGRAARRRRDHLHAHDSGAPGRHGATPHVPHCL